MNEKGIRIVVVKAMQSLHILDEDLYAYQQVVDDMVALIVEAYKRGYNRGQTDVSDV